VGYHVWSVLLDLFQKGPVLLSITITGIGVAFAITIKWIIHGDELGWAHLMIGSDLSLAAVLIATLQALKHDQFLAATQNLAATRAVWPAVVTIVFGALCILISVNIERVAYTSDNETSVFQYSVNLLFGVLVAVTATFGLV